MSWLKRLFGGGSDAAPAEPDPAAETEHRGFTIRAEPYKTEGGYQTAGTILKVIDGETRTHSFVRADRCSTLEDATALTLRKGQQIVDEQGERIFSGPA